MRNNWLTTFAALFCVAGLTATPSLADPAGMAMRNRQPAKQASTISWPWSRNSAPAAPIGAAMPGPPADHISAKQHPIKYLKKAVSKLPIAFHGKHASAPRAAMPPAQQKVDAISLSTPTGPPSPEFFIYAAHVCERQGDVSQARSNFQRALSMWPGHPEVLRSAARMEDRQANLPLAEKLYQQAVNANPQHVGALNDLGLCLARQGKLEPSVQMLEQAVQLEPTKALYRNNAATVLIEMRQDQRALSHLAAVHGSAEANYNLGQLLVERGRSAEAAPYFQAALQQNPNMQPAQDALAKLQGNQVAVSLPPAVQAPVTPVLPQPPVQLGQPMAPQQAWAAGQPFTYPATGQNPAIAAPTYPSPTSPRYLPPVATRPGAVRR